MAVCVCVWGGGSRGVTVVEMLEIAVIRDVLYLAFLNLRPNNWHKDANRCCYGVHMYSCVSELDPSVSKSLPLSSGSGKTSP